MNFKIQPLQFLSNLNTALPIMCEIKGKHSWITFGEDNRFPIHLLEMYNNSSIHNAILEKKTRAVAGSGIEYTTEGLSLAEKSQISFILRNFSYNENIEQLIYKISNNFLVYGSICLEVIWDRSGKKIAQVNHIDPMNIRIGDIVEGKVPYYYYSEDWKRWGTSGYEPVIYPAFNPSTAKKNPRQLLYVKHYRSGNKYYGIPSYYSARFWIHLDSQLGMYFNSYIEKGFAPALWITYKDGVPSVEEQEEIYNSLNAQYRGAANAGRTVISYVDDPDKAPDIRPVETSGLDQQFIALNDMILQNVLTGHGVTSPMIMGIKTEGQLGGSTELDIAYKQFEAQEIKPIRDIVEDTLNMLLSYMMIGLEISILPLKPIDFTFSESVLKEIMTKNEMRAAMKLPDLEEETETTADEFKEVKLSSTPPCHDNCKCSIVDGVWLNETDICDYCIEQKNKYND